MDLPTPTPFLILSPNELSSKNDKLPPSGRRNWNLKPENASGLSNAEQNFPGIQQSMLEMGIPTRCIPWDTAKAQATYNESTVVLDMQSKL